MPSIQYKHRVNQVLTTASSITLDVRRMDTEQLVHENATPTESTTGIYIYTWSDPAYNLEYQVTITADSSETTRTVFGESDVAYINVTEGDTYFENNIFADAWDTATNDQKLWALEEATKRIDALALVGDLFDEDQALAFPRTFQDAVPTEVEEACADIALKLLEEMDTDEEENLLHVSSRSYAGTRTTHDTKTSGKPWIATRIMSKDAWNKLIPYMHNARFLRMIRG